MPGPSILTLNQFDEFDRGGVLCLRGLLSADRVCRACEYVQDRLIIRSKGEFAGDAHSWGSRRPLLVGRDTEMLAVKLTLGRSNFPV
jgi:hypothetical protein